MPHFEATDKLHMAYKFCEHPLPRLGEKSKIVWKFGMVG